MFKRTTLLALGTAALLLAIPPGALATTETRSIADAGITLCGDAGCFTTTGVELKKTREWEGGSFTIGGKSEYYTFPDGRFAYKTEWDNRPDRTQIQTLYLTKSPIYTWNLKRYTLKDLDQYRCTTIRDEYGAYWSVDIPDVDRETKYQCDAVAQLAVEVVQKNRVRSTLKCTVKFAVAACRFKNQTRTILRSNRDTSLEHKTMITHKHQQVANCGHSIGYGSFYVMGANEAVCNRVRMIPGIGVFLVHTDWLNLDRESVGGYPCELVVADTVCSTPDGKFAYRTSYRIPDNHSISVLWDRDLGLWHSPMKHLVS